MKFWISSGTVCLALAMLTVAGCNYPHDIRVGAKTARAAAREPAKVADDMMTRLSEFQKAVREIKNAKSSRPDVREFVDNLKGLSDELGRSLSELTPDKLQDFLNRYAGRFATGAQGLEIAIQGMQTIKGLPDDFNQSMEEVKKLLNEVKEPKAAPPAAPEPLAASAPPDTSSYIIWIIIAIIMGACLGFLFRDGLWSNAIRLVNVVFAGLLAMALYEPLARMMTTFNDDLHSYVPFFDFLAMWACFVFFAAIFRGITDYSSRVRVRFLQVVDRAGSIVLSLCIGWIMTGFALASLHTAPLGEYPMLGCFQPQREMVFGLAPDREWLSFTQYQTAGPLYGGTPFPGDFITKHHERRVNLESYIRKTQAIRVNKDMMKKAPPPQPAPAPE
jgi:hypothetical protein